MQVFINKVATIAAYLDHNSAGFPPFGEVIEGLDVLDMLYTGYGEQVTNLQSEIENNGNAFLEKNFPRLDKINTAVIEPLPDDSSKDAPASSPRRTIRRRSQTCQKTKS